MARASREGGLSESRQYLNFLSGRLAEIGAKKQSLEEYYNPLKKEYDGINNLMKSVKHQIRREEGLDSIKDIAPTDVTPVKYKIKSAPKYEVQIEVPSSEEKKEDQPADESSES